MVVLGLDNIGVFDRSAALPTGGYLEQADGTARMALFADNMLEITSELAMADDDYASHQTGWSGIVARILHMFSSTTAQQVVELGQNAAITETRSGPAACAHGRDRPGVS